MNYRCVVLAGLASCAVVSLSAQQALPTTQPKLVNIIREIEKPGHGSAHRATEAKWAAFNRRMGYPSSYISLVASSGVPEMWFVAPFADFDGLGKTLAYGADNPAYTQGTAKLEMEDGDHLSNAITMQVRAIPEASSGNFPDVSKIRVYSVLTVTMKTGYEAQFTEIAKHYIAAMAGAPGIAGGRAYEVVSGAPGGTFLVLSSFPSWAAVDANETAVGSAMANAGVHLEAIDKLVKEAVQGANIRYFTVDGQSSVVPKELAADPFWAVKAASAPKKPTP